MRLAVEKHKDESHEALQMTPRAVAELHDEVSSVLRTTEALQRAQQSSELRSVVAQHRDAMSGVRDATLRHEEELQRHLESHLRDRDKWESCATGSALRHKEFELFSAEELTSAQLSKDVVASTLEGALLKSREQIEEVQGLREELGQLKSRASGVQVHLGEELADYRKQLSMMQVHNAQQDARLTHIQDTRAKLEFRLSQQEEASNNMKQEVCRQRDSSDRSSAKLQAELASHESLRGERIKMLERALVQECRSVQQHEESAELKSLDIDQNQQLESELEYFRNSVAEMTCLHQSQGEEIQTLKTQGDAVVSAKMAELRKASMAQQELRDMLSEEEVKNGFLTEELTLEKEASQVNVREIEELEQELRRQKGDFDDLRSRHSTKIGVSITSLARPSY